MRTFCDLTTDGMLEYLGAIYRLGCTSNKVTTGALADTMCVTAAAASSMLKRLDDSGFIRRSSVHGITLTEQGTLAALQLIRRHRLLEVFLVQIMGFTWDQVDAEARRLEHAISPAFEHRIAKLCGGPTHCPHGEPIPAQNGEMPEEWLVPILELDTGQTGMLRRVSSRDASVLRYLSKEDLMPGQMVKLVDVAPINGTVTVELLASDGQQNGGEQKVVGNELASLLHIKLT